MPIVSISEASRLVNKCRQTIYKHIRQGKLSTSACVDGSKGLDTSELIRVYGVLTVDGATNVDTNNFKQQTTKESVDDVNTVDTNSKQKLINLEKELSLSRLKLEQQEKELHYKQTIIDNKQEIIDNKERTIVAKQETIDTLKSALKLLEYKRTKDDVGNTEVIPNREPEPTLNEIKGVSEMQTPNILGRLKKWFK